MQKPFKVICIVGPEHEKNTPLHVAVFFEMEDLIHLLLQRGASVHAKNSFEMTPLHMAALVGAISGAEILLRHGANPDEPSRLGRPLHLALRFENNDVVELLLKYGAKPCRLPEDQESPAEVAKRVGNYEGLALLVPFAMGECDQDVGLSMFKEL